jgi:hypothetical protein
MHNDIMVSVIFINPADFKGIIFKTDSDLIAIGKIILECNLYMVLTSADLTGCFQRSNIYICERYQVLRYDLEGTSPRALHSQNPTSVRENCKIERKPLRETVYQLTDTVHQNILSKRDPFST